MIYKWYPFSQLLRRYSHFAESTIWNFGIIDFLLNFELTVSRLHWAYSELKHMHLLKQLKGFLMIYKGRQLSHLLLRYSRFAEGTICIFGIIVFLLNLALTLSRPHWANFELKHMHLVEQLKGFVLIYKWCPFSHLLRRYSHFPESTIWNFGIIDFLLNLAPTLSRPHWVYFELKHMHLLGHLKGFLMIYKWCPLSHL